MLADKLEEQERRLVSERKKREDQEMVRSVTTNLESQFGKEDETNEYHSATKSQSGTMVPHENLFQDIQGNLLITFKDQNAKVDLGKKDIRSSPNSIEFRDSFRVSSDRKTKQSTISQVNLDALQKDLLKEIEEFNQLDNYRIVRKPEQTDEDLASEELNN